MSLLARLHASYMMSLISSLEYLRPSTLAVLRSREANSWDGVESSEKRRKGIVASMQTTIRNSSRTGRACDSSFAAIRALRYSLRPKLGKSSFGSNPKTPVQRVLTSWFRVPSRCIIMRYVGSPPAGDSGVHTSTRS
eukprot:scaffold582_cov385-Prasinococcus_capsulatus_cf.AAC.8